MARDPRVNVRIEAKDRASPEIKKLDSNFGRLASTIKGPLLAAAATATAGFVALAAAVRSGVTAARESEEASIALKASLSSLGPEADKVAAQLEAQADALQKVTRFGDDAIVRTQALLSTMGVTAAKLPLATQATVDLAEAFGFSLEQAARNVGRTIGGFAGELGELIPQLKQFTAEELQAAKGIEFLAEAFEGRATEGAKTFGGALAQTGSAINELRKALGAAFVENEKIRESVAKFRDVLSSEGFVDNVTKVAEGTARWAATTLELVTAIANLPEKIREVNEAAKEQKDWWDKLIDANNRFQTRLDEMNAVLTLNREEMERLGFTQQQIADIMGETVSAYEAFTGVLTEADEEMLRGVGIGREYAQQQRENAEAVTLLADAEQRAARIQKEMDEGLKGLSAIANEFGINLKEGVNAALEENAEQLAKVRHQIQEYGDANGQLTVLEAALLAQQRELNGELANTGEAAREAGAGVEDLGDSLVEFDFTQRRTQQGLRDTAREFNSATRAALAFATVTGGGVTARDPRSQADVDDSIRMGLIPIMGGTKIRMWGGGSRLIGTRTGDFTPN